MLRLLPTADYTVTCATAQPTTSASCVSRRVGQASHLSQGQFVFLHVGGDDAWHEHPFSIAGTGPGRELRLSVRARGSETRSLSAELTPVLPATVSGAYGMFDWVQLVSSEGRSAPTVSAPI